MKYYRIIGSGFLQDQQYGGWCRRDEVKELIERFTNACAKITELETKLDDISRIARGEK